MEEILASIRRIISEDDMPAAEPAPMAAAPSPQPEPMASGAEEDDVLELTERVETPSPVHSVGDLDFYDPDDQAEPEPPPPMARPEPTHATPVREEPLMARSAAVAAASSFGRLQSTILMPRDGRTLEDVARELLMPLLKGWLDENLPRIVQAKVDEEVERIARGRLD